MATIDGLSSRRSGIASGYKEPAIITQKYSHHEEGTAHHEHRRERMQEPRSPQPGSEPHRAHSFRTNWNAAELEKELDDSRGAR